MKNLLLAAALSISAAGCAAGEANEGTAGAANTPAAIEPASATAADPGAAGPKTVAAGTETSPTRTPAPAPAEDSGPAWREVTIPAGTTLPLTLRTAVASDTSDVEDAVRATLRRAITIDGVQALPAGAVLTGHVTDAARSARVKGRARIAFRFTRIERPGDDGAVAVRTGTVARVAPATKKRDAATIGGGAVGGAIVGGILGGGDGAAKGAAIGGGAGTAAVLATRGKEVRLAAGTPLSVKLSAPLTLRVPLR